MTTNAFIFSWDCDGVEAIIPITQYEDMDKRNLINILAERKKEANPLHNIIYNLMMRARFNPQRHYEIYTIDCSKELDEAFWRAKWNDDPQFCADLIREKGLKIYSDRATKERVIF
jgi:hypothetical protein